MLKASFTVDESLFVKKMGRMGMKVIPYSRIQAQYIAQYGLRAVKLFTLRGKGEKSRTSGRKKIAELWKLTQSRQAYQDLYTIHNLYPNQDVVVFFEEGTAQHTFGPSKKIFLKFQDPDTGEDVFAKVVDNPGMPATHMMEKTEQVLYPRVDLWQRETFAMVDREMK